MKLGGWMVMLTAMMMFLTFMGVPTSFTPTLDILNIDINSSTSELQEADIEGSTLFKSLFIDEAIDLFGISLSGGILIALIGGGSLIIGLFAKGYDVSLVILPFIIAVAGIYVSTFWKVISYMATFDQWWMTSIVGLIFGTLAIGFIVSCVDYFAGR